VDHLGRRDHRGIAGDVLDPAPTPIPHPGQVRPGQPDPGQHVHLEIAPPVRVGDLQGRLGAEDAQVADQDVDLRQDGQDVVRAGRHVGRDRDVVARREGGDRLVHRVRRAAVDADPGTRGGQPGRDGPADALRGTGHKRGLSREIQLHGR
jgi:hypothetical protein